jgi:type IV secretory pathway VirJ component
VMQYYVARWKRNKVIAVGYSQGADVLSFAINRLPPESRERITKTVLISPGVLATFEFHVSSWLGASGDVPILPEALRLSAANTLCLYGHDEGDSLCPKLADSKVPTLALPGGHHYNGDYAHVAAAILEQLPPGP